MYTEHAGINTEMYSDKEYAKFVNPEWVRLLSILGLDRNFVRSLGAELFCDNGHTYLDFLSGYGVYNAGHHHPYITSELIRELHSFRPTMLQSTVCALAGQLASRLCQKAGGKADKVYFGSSGSEGVESAIKFSRKFTKRDWILYAEGGFHGLTCGALSLMSNTWWKDGFGPLLKETQAIPFGDIEALRKEIETERYASYIVEPVQGESGIRIPDKEYMKEAQRLCEKHGTLFVLDEVQTGVHRTGPFLASHHFGVEPDMTIMAKALSGGNIPVGALLMRDDICRSVYNSAEKAFVHTSTFSENTLAMRAALATLDVMEDENIEAHTNKMGELLRSELRKRLSKYEIVKEVRGLGLFNAVEFKCPSSLGLKLLFNVFKKAHPGLFGQMVVKTIFEKERVLCQMAGNDYMSIKSLPPLVIQAEQIISYAESLERVCESITNDKATFWPQGVKIAGKILGAKIS